MQPAWAADRVLGVTQHCFWVQLAVCLSGGALTGLEPRPVLSGVGVGSGVAVPAMAMVGVAPSRDPAALPANAPSRGFAPLSAFGVHLGLRVSWGPQRPNQIGLETDMRATKISGVGLVAMGILAEARATAGDDIGPPRKCPRPVCSGAGRG